jgi:type I restriction enzyme S subunit
LVDKDDLYAVNQRVCALTSYRDCPKYLFYVLNRNPYFLKFDDGVNQTHLLNRVFQRCPLAIPPALAEQEAIATILTDMDAEIAALEEKLAKARQLKQGMMQELLTGRIRLPVDRGRATE